MSAHIGKSGFRGVTRERKSKLNPWAAQMWIEKRHFHIGTYRTAEEAHRAYLRFRFEDAPRIRAAMKGLALQ